jgi:hypothetical protein
LVCPILEYCSSYDHVDDIHRGSYCWTDAAYVLCRFYKKWRLEKCRANDTFDGVAQNPCKTVKFF